MDLKINTTNARNISVVLFFAYRVWYAMLRFNSNGVTSIIAMILPYLFGFVAIVLDQKKTRAIINIGIIVLLCAMAFFITYMLHPEYVSWYYNLDYGVFNNVFFPTDGLYAVFFISLCDDSDQLRKCMRVISFLFLVYAFYQIIPVIRTGHWDVTSKTGLAVNQRTYSLGFGYRTMICVVFFLNEFFETKKKVYIILSIIPLWLVINYGGRGCLLVLIIYLFAITLEKLGKNLNGVKLLSLIILFVISTLIVINLQTIGQMLIDITGNNSRTLQMIATGDMLNDNARNIIWGMAVELIKTGGLFGHGAYGDRYVIGRFYSWGYCHNIFLELLVCFGIIGVFIIIILAISMFRFFNKEDDKWWRYIMISAISLSGQLLISDSFWYNTWFWVVIGILMTRKIEKRNMVMKEFRGKANV